MNAIKSIKRTIFKRIGDLIEEHNLSDTPYLSCSGCSICDEITRSREQLDLLQNKRIKQILAKGENLTKKDIHFLLEKDVHIIDIANSIKISTFTLNTILNHWKLHKKTLG